MRATIYDADVNKKCTQDNGEEKVIQTHIGYSSVTIDLNRAASLDNLRYLLQPRLIDRAEIIEFIAIHVEHAHHFARCVEYRYYDLGPR